MMPGWTPDPECDCRYCQTGIHDGYGHNDGPYRIQRKRARGWRMPEGTMYVGRPTRWGNPFEVDIDWTRRAAAALGLGSDTLGASLRLYRAWITGDPLTYGPGPISGYRIEFTYGFAGGRAWLEGTGVVDLDYPPGLAPLRGRNLACWCPLEQPCHADVLIELANGVYATGINR